MVVSVGQDINWPVDGAQRCNWKIKIISHQNVIRTRKGGASSHLHLWSQLLFAMVMVVLAGLVLGGVCGMSYVRSCGGWRSNSIEK